MKTKKYLIAIAIFSGVLFTVDVAVTYSNADQNTDTAIDREKLAKAKKKLGGWG